MPTEELIVQERNNRIKTSTRLEYEKNSVKLQKEHTDKWDSLMHNESLSVASIQKSVARRTRPHNTLILDVNATIARSAQYLDNLAVYQGVAYRDHLVERWNRTQNWHTQQDVKRVYYLSMEFLIGRSLDNAVLNLEAKGLYKDAMRQLGFDLEDLIEQEMDAALGNGGLGRLAACFMDSLATQDYPAWGYGLRYNYGIFQQRIIDGFQVEYPDFWLTYDNIWEMPRHDVVYEIRFYGEVTKIIDENGKTRRVWDGGEIVEAVAHDVPIPGFRTNNCINIRLWRSVPKKKFDFASFNEGHYQKSVEENMKAENITSVLYPNDNTMAGKELRLKQQYFFVSATLKDIVRRFKKKNHPWSEFPNHVAIQLNDTHPTLGIPELQRRLVDIEGLEWDVAFAIVRRTFSFTNHTVLPEAMEKWTVPMIAHILPRHMEIIFDINLFFLQAIEKRWPNDREKLVRLSIIEESSPQMVRMAHLAIVGSHTVNGVAEIHSSLIRQTIFKDFVEFYGPEKFQNKTNGITPRRWLHQANMSLSDLIAERLGGDDFLKHLDRLRELRNFSDDDVLQRDWMQGTLKIKVRADALFDIQVKRIHEYKRQFMNILSVIHRYYDIKSMSAENKAKVVPRVVIFGGKAAPGYYIAKLVIKLINSVAEVVNRDPSIGDLLKVVFLEDYNVSLAELIVPASDISQHISTAGTEASGTSNMKFVLNGGLILGTLDGANIEIRDEIGHDNMFVFGVKAHEVDDIRHAQRFRKTQMNPDLVKIIDSISNGAFGAPKTFTPLLETLTIGGDFYLVSADFASYLKAQCEVDAAFKDKKGWTKKSIMCTAGMGKFSSDRSIIEYAEQIWKLKPSPVPGLQ